MTSTPYELDGLILITPRVWEDRRGFFFEAYNRRTFGDAGIAVDFVQDNHSRSCPRTVRGLHYQAPPHAQDKLVRVLRGTVLDVVVDIRRNSPTFGQWTSVELSEENRRMLFVPKGFAHGFCVTGDGYAEILYKCSDFYAPDSAFGIRWDDPDLAIDWPLKGAPVLSDQDQGYPHLADAPEHFSC